MRRKNLMKTSKDVWKTEASCSNNTDTGVSLGRSRVKANLRRSPQLHIGSFVLLGWALGKRSFQYIGPVIWNSLPLSVRNSVSLSTFKSKLKTRVFSSAD